MTRLVDKVVLITGGGAGIGRHYAHRFAAEGACIAVTDIDEAAAQGVAGEWHRPAVRGDRAEDGRRRRHRRRGGRRGGDRRVRWLDVLINNAAIHLDHAQMPFTLEALPQWQRVLEVNVLGALACAAACRPAMAGRPGASIINHSSMAAYGFGGAYSVSKLALNSLTVGLAGEFASDGIRVNGIAPGLVDSESAVQWAQDPQRAGLPEQLVAQQAIKRPGRMADLADMALFLASAQAGFVTGQTILVDGGFTKKPF